MSQELKIDKVKYTECYIAFLDILGFSDLVKESDIGSDSNILPVLVRVLNDAAELSGSEHVRNNHYFRLQARAFSDSVVLFLPTESHALSWLLDKVRYLHDRVLELNCCLRGAVTIGKMYWDDSWSKVPASSKGVTNSAVGPTLAPGESAVWERGVSVDAEIVLGPAYIEAYKLESGVAIYPRVIFSRKLMDHIRSHYLAEENSAQCASRAMRAFPICSSGSADSSEGIIDFVRRDFDGVYHLHMFHRDIDRNDTVRIIRSRLEDGRFQTKLVCDEWGPAQFMAQVRKTILLHMNKASDDKICAKLQWLANYFNESLLEQSGVDPIKNEW